MVGQPRLHVFVLVGGVVVQDQMELKLSWKLAIESAQESQEFLVSVASKALADDLSIERVQCGKQSRGAVTLVVVGHRAASAALHRQSRLGPVERLNLALLVHAQDDSILWRVKVQPNNVGQLLNKPLVFREFEGLGPVRLKPMASQMR